MLSQSPGLLVIVWVVFPYNRPTIAFEHIWNKGAIGTIRTQWLLKKEFLKLLQYFTEKQNGYLKSGHLPGLEVAAYKWWLLWESALYLKQPTEYCWKIALVGALAVTKSDATNRLKSTTPSPPKVSDSSLNRCPDQARVSLSMTREEKVERGRIYCLHFVKFWWVFLRIHAISKNW